MSSEMPGTVKVRILDKEYQVSCPPDERDALRASARYLDQQMRTIRQGGKVIGMERIAVMAALNMSHELIQKNQHENDSTVQIEDRIRQITSRLDETINHYNQIEI